MLDRAALIRLGIYYAAANNQNMPGQVRRVLSQKFGVHILEIEAESECQRLAGETVLALADAARKAKA